MTLPGFSMRASVLSGLVGLALLGGLMPASALAWTRIGETPEVTLYVNRNSIENADLSVWLEEDEEVRKQRWITREGNDEHWASWAAQELDFYARERSAELAGRRAIGSYLP